MDKRKFLFASLSGLIGDIAWQVSKEGHEVRYYIEAEKERDIADGLVGKSKDWEKDAVWADIVVFDDTLGQGTRRRLCAPAASPSSVAHRTPHPQVVQPEPAGLVVGPATRAWKAAPARSSRPQNSSAAVMRLCASVPAGAGGEHRLPRGRRPPGTGRRPPAIRPP